MLHELCDRRIHLENFPESLDTWLEMAGEAIDFSVVNEVRFTSHFTCTCSIYSSTGTNTMFYTIEWHYRCELAFSKPKCHLHVAACHDLVCFKLNCNRILHLLVGGRDLFAPRLFSPERASDGGFYP